MATLFISDLHLEDSRPEMTRVLLEFLASQAREAEALYILGDLFEYWIGDDAASPTAVKVADGIRDLADSGVPCHFMHGNRDFLLGQHYAATAGFSILPETIVVDLYGTPTLLLHGDTLCTDDAEYQAFRRQVRNENWQRAFLAQSVDARIAVAQQARDASRQHTSTAAMDIMDVNEEAVQAAFTAFQVRNMIHGHTHRPAVHQHQLDDGTTAERIVLADWYDRGSALRVTPDGAETIDL
ncbi:MAG: UDP-2,3-diacylglucosamine diphosphatase [Xanthomonadales bacterium]|nr:UDP-2,3-diacylglucosamine diphosphatase [Xanthomonadales bacterium]